MAGTIRTDDGLWSDGNWSAGIPGAGVTWDLMGYDVEIGPGYVTEEVGDGDLQGGILHMLNTSTLDLAGRLTVDAGDALWMEGGSRIRVVCSVDDQAGREVKIEGLTSNFMIQNAGVTPAQIYSKDPTKRAQRGLYLSNSGASCWIKGLEIFDFSDTGLDLFPAYVTFLEDICVHDISASSGRGIYVRYCGDIAFRNVCVYGCKTGLTVTYGSVSLYNCRFGKDLAGGADQNTTKDLDLYDATVRAHNLVLASTVKATPNRHNDVLMVANYGYNAEDGIITAQGTPGTDYSKAFAGEITEAASKRVLTPNSNCGATAHLIANYKPGGLGFQLAIPAVAGDVVQVVLKATSTTATLRATLRVDELAVSEESGQDRSDTGNCIAGVQKTFTVTGTARGSAAEKVLVPWFFSCNTYSAGAYLTIDEVTFTVAGVDAVVDLDRWALPYAKAVPARPALWGRDDRTGSSATFRLQSAAGVLNHLYHHEEGSEEPLLAGQCTGPGYIRVGDLREGAKFLFDAVSTLAGLNSLPSNMVRLTIRGTADALTFADHVADYLERQGLGTVGEDIFSQARPDHPDACLVLLDTGGAPPDPHTPLQEPTVQVLARASAGDDALGALADVVAAFSEADGRPRSNFYLDEAGSVWVNIVRPLGLPGLLGLDAEGRALASVNFLFEMWRRQA